MIIHIGFPKSGSSFLQRYFTINPSISFDINDLNKLRMTGVLDDDLIDKTINKDGIRVLSAEQLSAPPFGFFKGENGYDGFDIQKFKEENAKELAQLFPNAKKLMIVRNFESLLSSVYSQYVIVGGVLKYSEFLKVHKSTLISLFDFDYTLNLYQKYFGKNNIVILPFELLKRNPSSFISTLEAEFGFEPCSFVPKEVNKSILTEYIPYVLILNRLVYELIALLPESKQWKIKFKYIRLLVRAKNTCLNKGKSKRSMDDKGELKDLMVDLKLRAVRVSRQKYMRGFEKLYRQSY